MTCAALRFLLQAGADGFGFSAASIGPAIGKLFGLGLMWRAVALYILVVRATGRYVPVFVEDAALRAADALRGACGHRRVLSSEAPPPATAGEDASLKPQIQARSSIGAAI
jgi:hypothetical protein